MLERRWAASTDCHRPSDSLDPRSRAKTVAFCSRRVVKLTCNESPRDHLRQSDEQRVGLHVQGGRNDLFRAYHHRDAR